MKRLACILLSMVMVLSASLFMASAVDVGGDDDLVYGDVDYSNSITAVDAQHVLCYAVGLESFDDDQLERADVNFDKQYDAVDATLILQASVGLRSLGWGQIIF